MSLIDRLPVLPLMHKICPIYIYILDYMRMSSWNIFRSARIGKDCLLEFMGFFGTFLYAVNGLNYYLKITSLLHLN